jgi:hypothetical protein
LEKPLRVNDNFTPCPVGDGDELYPNGIFEFNITKIIEYIQENTDRVALEEVAVSDFPNNFSSINESHVDSVDISQPVVLAEISPGRFTLIDGHHRMEKARRMGINSVRAYKLSVEQHMRFLISKEAYVAYVGYWNGKLKGMGKMGRPYDNKKIKRTIGTKTVEQTYEPDR